MESLKSRLEVTSFCPGGKEHAAAAGLSRHSSVKFPATGTLAHELGATCTGRKERVSLGYQYVCAGLKVFIRSKVPCALF